jgi:N4-gp56 family major capsid protein
MATTLYGDISPRTATFAERELLKRALPYLVLEKFGQSKPIPTKSSKTIKFRKYNPLALATAPITEGVTPSSKQLTADDVTANLEQYGDLITITDIVLDTHEDPVLSEATEILGEQAAQTIETIRFDAVKAGTNVRFSNGTGRSAVNTPITTALQRKCTRDLKRNNARPISKIVRSTPSYGTEAVAPSFIGLVHPDMESDIRSMVGFVPTEKYGSITPYESEIGKVEDVRYISSTVFKPWDGSASVGGSTTSMLNTGGSADVYPVLFLARDAYGIIPLKGRASITPSVVNPHPSESDPLGQRGHIGWKSMQTCKILQETYMIRAEVAVTD